MQKISCDNIIINKTEIIRRCLKRIAEEYQGHEKEFDSNYTKQDSIILNLHRLCEAAVDLAIHVVRLCKLGMPQSSREVFDLLEREQIIPPTLAKELRAMVGFRNIAVHDYQRLNLEVVRSILEHKLGQFDELIQHVQKMTV